MLVNLQPVVKSLSVSCDRLVAHCTQHQCQSCEDTYDLYSAHWKEGEGGVEPFDHLRFKILSSCEAQVADVDVVSKSERKLPGVRIMMGVLHTTQRSNKNSTCLPCSSCPHFHIEANVHIVSRGRGVCNTERKVEVFVRRQDTKPGAGGRPTCLDCKPPSLQVATILSAIHENQFSLHIVGAIRDTLEVTSLEGNECTCCFISCDGLHSLYYLYIWKWFWVKQKYDSLSTSTVFDLPGHTNSKFISTEGWARMFSRTEQWLEERKQKRLGSIWLQSGTGWHSGPPRMKKFIITKWSHV